MTSDPGVPIRKPVSIWQRPIEVKFGALAKALGKGAIAGAFGNWENLAGSGVDTLEVLGLSISDARAIACNCYHVRVVGVVILIGAV